jgi:hypothetical protein
MAYAKRHKDTGFGGGKPTNVQYKPMWNCYNVSPLYNEYILIKKIKKKN